MSDYRVFFKVYDQKLTLKAACNSQVYSKLIVMTLAWP